MLRRWCDEVGRDESEIERTVQGGVADHPRHRSRRRGRSPQRWTERNSGWSGPGDGLLGPAELVAERWAPYLDLGFDHVYVDCPAPFDHETLERLATEVKPVLEAR